MTMAAELTDVPRDMRGQIAAAIRQRGGVLAEQIAGLLSAGPGLDPAGWRTFAQVAVDLMAVAVEDGDLDERRGAIHGLTHLTPPLTLRQLIEGVHRSERIVLDDLALHDRLGVTSESWPIVAHAVRAAAIEVISAVVERTGGRPALRDALTTLLTKPVFTLALQQEALRALRHKHGVSMILFDIDDLSQVNRSHGIGAGNRLLERLGILARSFFRTHDWVARHGEDSIAVLLPEATLDQAATLAGRFSETVQQRLVLVEHKTEARTIVTVSAAAVGTDLVQAEIDPRDFMAEAEAALVRAKMNGGNRVERVALLPTSVTILGAATLLGKTAREVAGMIRRGELRAARRGRHFHIDRTQIDAHRTRKTP
jgi:diguanylate cyclase (GGDEF)-like protein/excisionase family DNA binding protein